MNSVFKFRIRTLEIAGLGSTLQALRLPFGKEARSVVNTSHEMYPNSTANGEIWDALSFKQDVLLHPKDKELIKTLVKRGDEHSKVLRGVMVWCEINAPRYWFQELSTYRIGTECLSSESTMHTIGKHGVSIENFELPEEIRYILSEKEDNVECNPLYIEEPENKECRVLTFFGRDYEIWNNGEIYALPFDVTDSSGRTRHFEKSKVSIGGTTNRQGYYQVRLGGKDGGQLLLHRIMAMAFIENPNNYPIVNHKDGNKANCSISNLEWCTASENCRHAVDTGLNNPKDLRRNYLLYKKSLKWTDEIVCTWKKLRSEGKSCKEISELFGTTESTVSSYTATKTGRYSFMSENSALFALAKQYEDTIAKINDLSDLYKESNDFDYVIRIKELLPETFMQKRIWMFSYQTLRRIYFQRRNHRLPQWRIFCDWIKTLPFAEEFITIEKE